MVELSISRFATALHLNKNFLKFLVFLCFRNEPRELNYSFEFIYFVIAQHSKTSCCYFSGFFNHSFLFHPNLVDPNISDMD